MSIIMAFFLQGFGIELSAAAARRKEGWKDMPLGPSRRWLWSVRDGIESDATGKPEGPPGTTNIGVGASGPTLFDCEY
jgi:hypothetical protein